MDKIQIEQELTHTFKSFFYHSLDLIKNMSVGSDDLKIAVVNMQIALELFLKLYFVKKNEFEKVVIEERNNKIVFHGFPKVLNHFYSTNKWSYGKKKEFVHILEKRNQIVHQGLNSGWNDELARYLIHCVFFIQGTMRSDFGETLISSEYGLLDHDENQLWVSGVESFIKNQFGEYESDGEPVALNCLVCKNRTLISKEYFNLCDTDDIEGLQCLCCFSELMFDYCTLIQCNSCKTKSYLIETLNPQKKGEHLARCLNCEKDTRVRKCAQCDVYYHPQSQKQECVHDEKYFCSLLCKEIYIEVQNYKK